MTRKQFVGSLLGLLVLPKLIEAAQPQRHAFNVEKLQARLSYLKKYPANNPETMIIRGRNGASYYYVKGIEEADARWEVEMLVGMIKHSP